MLQCSCKRMLKSFMRMLKCFPAQQPMSCNELSHLPHGGAGIERVNDERGSRGSGKGRKGQQREWEGTSVEEAALQKARLSLPFDLFHAHWELSQWARRVHGGSGRLVCMASGRRHSLRCALVYALRVYLLSQPCASRGCPAHIRHKARSARGAQPHSAGRRVAPGAACPKPLSAESPPSVRLVRHR
jgi:hypothetical protein